MSEAGDRRKHRSLLTDAIHGGETRPRAGHSITTPIYQTATYVFRDTAELVDYMSGGAEREEYGRYGNPTQRVAEAKCAALEGAEAGLGFASGMAAITTTLFAVLSQGQHVVMTDDCYRRTRQFCVGMLSRFGVEVTIVPTGECTAIAFVSGIECVTWMNSALSWPNWMRSPAITVRRSTYLSSRCSISLRSMKPIARGEP